jgi:hypothetical protein
MAGYNVCFGLWFQTSIGPDVWAAWSDRARAFDESAVHAESDVQSVRTPRTLSERQ